MLKGNVMDKRELLIKTREILLQPESWCKGRLAIDAIGLPVAPESENAVSFCLWGGMLKAVESRTSFADYSLVSSAGYFLETFLDASRWQNIVAFNNDEKTTHPEILELLDKAITHAQ